MADIAQYHDIHPLYTRLAGQWRTLRAAYLGGREWNAQDNTYQIAGLAVQPATPGKTGPTNGTLIEHRYLWRHPREKDDRYRIRLRASTYENVVRPLVTTIAATIAKACKKCEWPSGMEYLEKDIDQCGMDVATFRLERIAWSHVYPHVFTLLERPEGDAQPSRYHELAAGLRTYARVVSPLSLIDWHWDGATREFDWALIVERAADERLPPDERTSLKEPGSTRMAGDVYTRLLKRGEWIRFKNGVEVERGTTGVDFVPLAIQYGLGQDPESAEPLGIDMLSDVVDKAIERFNKESWLTDQEMNQCFNQAHIKAGDGGLPPDELEIAVGTNTYIPAEVFEWVAPSVEPMTHLQGSIANDGATIRQMLGVETKGEDSAAAKSGIALQLEQTSVSSMFSGYASAAEAGERAIWRMVAELEGLDPDEVMVEYARDFSALETSSRFAQLMEALTNGGFQGSARASLQKQVWVAVNPDAEDDERQAAFADIDAEVTAEREREASRQEAVKALSAMPMNGAESEREAEPADDAEDMTEGKANGKPMPMGNAS